MAESAQILEVSKPWHEDLAEFLIANPHKSMAEVAAHYGVTAPWLSTVKNSDAFRDYYDARRGEHFSAVSLSLVEKVSALAELSVEALTKQVSDHTLGAPMAVDTLMNVTDLALKSLGFGAKKSGEAPQQNNTLILVGDQAALERARSTLRTVRERVIDADLEREAAGESASGETSVVEQQPQPQEILPPSD